MELYLSPGASRGYWKYHTFGNDLSRPTHIKINNEKVTQLFYSVAKASIIDTALARKIGSVIDEIERQEWIGIEDSIYITEGRAKVKFTLAKSLMYYFDVYVSNFVDQEAILRMDYIISLPE